MCLAFLRVREHLLIPALPEALQDIRPALKCSCDCPYMSIRQCQLPQTSHTCALDEPSHPNSTQSRSGLHSYRVGG